jgi:uncharacterized protein
MVITAFYAGLLVPLFIILAARVIRERSAAQLALGDGGQPMLLRVIRVHANFAEYVPLALLMMALAESLRTPALLLHGLGLLLLVGRISHAYGVSCPKERLQFRVTGMMATFTVLIAGALICLFQSFRSGIF